MSESTTEDQDQLIENALALLKDAVREEPFRTQSILPPAHFSSTETNVVVTTQHFDGHTSVVAASEVEVVNIDGPEQQPVVKPKLDREVVDASAAAQTEPEAELIEQTLAIMRTTTEKQQRSQSGGLSANLASPKSWLDTERADMHNRVKTFRATQNRFQRERAKYCDGALAAAVAGEWKPSQQ